MSAQSTENKVFDRFRIYSRTRPGNEAGLRFVYVTGYPGYLTFEDLASYDAHNLCFYADSMLQMMRGDFRKEEFELQGGNGDEWTTIKPIVPLDPSTLPDDDEIDFGNCSECKDELTESESALGYLCDFCRDKAFKQQEIDRQIAEEERSERQLFAGDYVTSDEDENTCGCNEMGCTTCRGKSYYCDNCKDSGCEQCQGPMCHKCGDQGCEDCDPQNICKQCGYVDYRIELLEEDRICTECKNDNQHTDKPSIWEKFKNWARGNN